MRQRLIRRLRAVTVVDPIDGSIRPRRDVVIESGRIISHEPTAAMSRRSRRTDGSELDGHDRILIPGLIDSHVHALGTLAEVEPRPQDLPWLLRQQRYNLRAFIRAGVTTVRDMGAPLHLIRLFSSLARANWLDAPRILYAGPVVSVAGGYPDFVPPVPPLLELILGPIVINLRSLGQVRATVRRLARTGVSCIKVMCQSAKYDDERSPLRTIPLQWRQALIAEARRFGLPVAAHHIYLDDLIEDLNLPYDALEHIPIDAPLPDSVVARIAERGVPISATLMTYGIIDHLEELQQLVERPETRFEPVPAAFLRRTIHQISTVGDAPTAGRRVIQTGSTHQRESVRRLNDAGAFLVNGTDQGGAITAPGNPHWELEDFVRAGLSPLDALRTATINAARALGRNDLGSLRPGSRADLVLLEPRANPLDDIGMIQKVSAVLRGGRLVFEGTH